MERLDGGEAHVWYSIPEAIADDGLLRAYERLLSPDEAAAGRRFLSPNRRHVHLVTRALVRTVLSRYAAVDPSAWVFSRNAWGRPEVAGPAVLGGVRFSLSHAPGCIACAVARDAEIGFDVEDTARRRSDRAIAERFFSAREASALRATPDDLRPRRFLETWTLKEAYVKARGRGLSIPFDSFSVCPGDDGAIRAEFSPALADDPEAWRFRTVIVTPAHVAALAVRTSTLRRVVTRETVPLQD